MGRRWIAALVGLSLLAARTGHAQAVTLTLDETVTAPEGLFGIGVNGNTSYFNFVGANMVDDPSFEGPDDGGFAHDGWPWASGGGLTPSIDTIDVVHGNQSQRLDVTGAPATMSQGRVELPQLPHILTARTTSIYRIKVMARSDVADARIRLGVVDEGWQERLGPQIPITTSWQVYEYDYVPASEHLLRGFAVGFEDNATYWLDDMLAWDTTDYDAETGLSATYVARITELNPDFLRLGGLGVNGIPLEAYLRERWTLGYGPPDLQPDFDLNTFLRLCRRVGAQPFITAPPAFSDDTSWQVGDLTDDVIANVYVDHGNLVDYIGGDGSTIYGARRQADGFDRWDLEFDAVYFEMGNELWGTPDDNWDMDPNENEPLDVQMQNYATYCDRRMTEMKGRPGWRGNMKVGFGGRSPTTWLGGWPGSYDGTLVPQIGDLTDFSTIDLYYGNGAPSDTDELIFGALFASAPRHEREIADMKTAFAAANNGTDIETTVYEGNATWGGYEGDLSNPSPLYFRSVSLGAAVSLVDVYAAANRAGVTVNNHFHYGGNVWGATGGYPAVNRKPAFYALKLLTTHVEGEPRTCTVNGGGSYDDPLTGETDVEYVACYPYRSGDVWYLLLVNRHRSESRQVEIAQSLAPVSRTSLGHTDINANNETIETVMLVTEPLDGILTNPVTETLPPHSAIVLVLSETGPPADGGGVSDGGVADAAAHDGPAGEPGEPAGGSSGGCGCGIPGDAGGLRWVALVLLLGWLRRRRRPHLSPVRDE